MGIFTAIGLRSGGDIVGSDAGVETITNEATEIFMQSSEVPKMSAGPRIGQGKRTEDQESLVEEVGRIIDREEEGENEMQKNPKKRMWEEEKEAEKRKDEL